MCVFLNHAAPSPSLISSKTCRSGVCVDEPVYGRGGPGHAAGKGNGDYRGGKEEPNTRPPIPHANLRHAASSPLGLSGNGAQRARNAHGGESPQSEEWLGGRHE